MISAKYKTFYGDCWLLLTTLLLFVFSCDSPDANDCFKTTGADKEMDMALPPFSRVLINRDVQAYIEQGDEYTIKIVSGENLIEDVIAVVEGDRLVVTDNNTCNFVRDYNNTKVYITAPDIKEIRASTQFDISSIGNLNYPQLTLISENFNEADTFPLADFRLQLNSESVTITSNNISSFFLSGQVDNLSIGFFEGIGRFEGENLIAEQITITHRASNDIIVNPQQSLEGVILGPGDVISINRPPFVNVEELYTGRLIFRD